MKKQKSRILLHTCCADCALKFIDSLDDQYDVTLYFDNNNIHPRSEYQERLKAIKNVAKEKGIPIIIPDWKPKQWFKAIENIEDNENLRRCRLCWKHRLEKTVEYAKNNGYKLFSTTLLTSHYQNKRIIKEIGGQLNIKGLKFYTPTKFKDIKTNGFYKQNYCGCVYSLKDRYFEKYSN